MRYKLKKLIFTFIFVNLLILTNSLQIYAEHTHNDSCYSGNVHFHEGDEIKGGACYQNPIPHTHNENCYVYSCEQTSNIEYTSSIEILGNSSCSNTNCLSNTAGMQDVIKKITNTCKGCGASSSKVFCALCDTVLSGTENVTHNTISYEIAKNNPNIYLICAKTSAEGYTLTCSLEEGKNYGELICGTKILSIVPENPVQSGNLNTNVIVTYDDEHTEIKSANSNYDTNKVYNGETITLTYQEFSTTITYYSTTTNTEVIIKDETQNDIIFSEESNVETTINDETNITNNEISQIRDESVEIKDETTEEFLEEVGLKEVTIKDPIIMDIEEEVTEIKNDVDLKTNNDTSLLIIGIIIGLFVVVGSIIVYFVTKIKKIKGK